jgi:hypothetical protein
MQKIAKALFVVVTIILASHSIIGLPSLIVFPSYVLLLLLMAFLTQKEKLRLADKVLLILGISVLASLSYAFVPFYVADRFPDANYINQLIRNYKATGKVITGMGTNQVYDYSYYPFEEVLMMILSEVSGVLDTLILRLFPFFNTLFLIIVWTCIYKTFLEPKEVYVALTIALTSFHLLVVFMRPLHPTFGLMFTSLLFLVWTARNAYMGRAHKIDTLVSVIFTIAIVLSHNTTALLISILFILSLLLIMILNILNKLPFPKFKNIGWKFSNGIKRGREIFYYIVLMLATYFAWNIYIAWGFFKLNIVIAIIKYIHMILSHEVIPLEILFGFSKGMKINIVGYNEFATQLAIMKTHIGYSSLALYLLLSGIMILKYMLCNASLSQNKKTKHVANLFVLLSLSSALVILFGALTWSYTFARDYYWRFYSYYFLFSSPITVFMLTRFRSFKQSVKPIIIFAILLNSILWLPSSSLGIDMPCEFSDPRFGITQAIILSKFIRDKYDERYIAGTRFVYNIIGPLSERWVTKVIYLESDYLIFINQKKNILTIISITESLIIGFQDYSFRKYNILYNSNDFVMLIGT